MPFLLDSNIISYLVREPQGRVAIRLSDVPPAEILTSVIVLGEIAYGFAKQPAPKLQRQTKDVLKGIEIVGLDVSVSAAYAAVRVKLERQGLPIGANDLWIAAHALALNATLISANEREFRRVGGLQVENWAV